MILTTYDQAPPFLRAAQAALEQNEALNNLFLGLALRAQALEKSWPQLYLAAVTDDDGLAAAAIITPPWKLVIQSDRPDFEPPLELIARGLLARPEPVAGVFGPVPLARAFAGIWHRLTGQRGQAEMEQRLYQLTRVIPPRPVPGSLRLGAPDDIDLLATWISGFYDEVSLGQGPIDPRQIAQGRVAEGSLYVWEDGWPVSMACKSRETARGVSINLVYTPPEFRGRGYASAAVAYLSQLLLDSGRQFCTLFTELANPTSNALYQRIGYTPVCDFMGFAFK